MYSQLSMARETSIDDCKPQGTHNTLGPVSIINEPKSMERDPLKGEDQGISHQSAQGTK
jgi:hypothetical protein